MSYEEGNRYLYLETPLGNGKLLLQSFTGSEGLSELFDFQVELLAENATAINFDQLIGKDVSFGIDGTESRFIARDFNGIVVEFMQGLRDHEFTAYRMRVRPAIWKLTKTYQSRIFQHMTVPDILKKVLTGFEVVYEIQGDFEEREYCTQYRETDFAFVSRLMEEEGMFYFFKFTHGAHKLVLGNTRTSHPDILGTSSLIFESTAGGLRDDERITLWQKKQIWGSGKYTTWDHHFQLPHKHLEAQATSAIAVQVGKTSHKLNLAQNEDLEVYDYPAAYAQRFDDIGRSGAVQDTLQNVFLDAKRTESIRIQQQETQTLLIQAASNCRQITPGHKFLLQQHFDGDGKYVVLTTFHDAAEADFRSAQSQEDENHYNNRFTCLPYDLPFRPPSVTQKPVIPGPQTAVVVGPGGEEIFTDKYGRVKVQFHWDRDGKYDADSSCWLRVGTMSAGKQWGSVFIPRVGHEVIVGFLEGDPDRPIIVGSVYNADTMPPYELPANKTRSGIKSDSSKGSSGFNEIRFEDKKGAEQIFTNAERNQDVRVKNDLMETVVHDSHRIVQNDHLEQITGDKHLSVKGDQNEKIDGTVSLKAGMNYEAKVGMNHALEAGTEIHLKAGMNLVVESGATLTLKVGGSFINLNPAGVFISGPMVMINSGGSAGSGAAANPDPPKKPKEADKANPGKVDQLQGNPPPPRPAVLSPAAIVLVNGARNGTPFCEVCARLAAQRAADNT